MISVCNATLKLINQIKIPISTPQEKINKEIQNSKLFNNNDEIVPRKQKGGRYKTANIKARTLMNLHNNEAGRRVSGREFEEFCIYIIYTLFVFIQTGND